MIDISIGIGLILILNIHISLNLNHIIPRSIISQFQPRLQPLCPSPSPSRRPNPRRGLDQSWPTRQPDLLRTSDALLRVGDID
jgi:hypothetical protein